MIEILVVFAMLAGLVAFLSRPRLRGCREVSTRVVCSSNLSRIGIAMKIYANDNADAWPVPAFDETRIGEIDYTVRPGSGQSSVRSPDRLQASAGGPGGARQLSTTRAFWMLVRAGDIVPKGFVCPKSGGLADPAVNIAAQHDFSGPNHVSYGFQVPFGPMLTRAGEWIDGEVPLAADRGPYRDARVLTPLQLGKAGWPNPAGPASWRPYNSPHHDGEGQNVLYADGHASFERLPIVGKQGDNIYTAALDTADASGRVAGESPWTRSAHPARCFGPNGVEMPTTDSVIFP